MDNAVIYCRVSTEEQTKNTSLAGQQKACEEYCARNGFSVAKIFLELGESAKTTNRTQLAAMLAYCTGNKGRVQYLVVLHTSRFARDSYDHAVLRAALSRMGIQLRSVQEQIDETPTGKFLETVLAGVNQLDNDLRAVRVSAGMRAAYEKGRWLGKPPLGYCKVMGSDGKKTLGLDPERAPLVQQLFERIASGSFSQREALRYANTEGLRTTNGKRVSVQSLNRMLCNPLYMGVVKIPKMGVEARGMFEPLISADTFSAVQRARQRKGPLPKAHFKKNPAYPLTQFVRCGTCNRPLTASKSRGRSGVRYSYYRCPANCTKNLSTLKLEQRFVEFLERLQPNPEYLELMKAVILDVWKEKQVGSLAQVKAMERTLAALQERAGNLLEAFVHQKAIDRLTYQRAIDKVNLEITLAEIDLHDAKLESLDVEVVVNFATEVLGNCARLWKEFSPEQKVRFQAVLFPSGVEYKAGAFGTAATCMLFNILAESDAPESREVDLTGKSWNQLYDTLLDFERFRKYVHAL